MGSSRRDMEILAERGASQLSGFCPQSLAFALSRRLRERRWAGLLSAAGWAAGLYRGASAAAIWEMESSVAVFSSGVAILGLEMAIFEAEMAAFGAEMTTSVVHRQWAFSARQ